MSVKRRPDYQPELRTEAAKLYAELHSVRKVAERMEISGFRVYQLLKDAGVLPVKDV